MPAATLPANEAARLQALRRYHILDTEAEAVFDRITEIVAQVFSAPSSLVSLVDENRQWFKSCYGGISGETPRSTAFCAHAILQDDVFIVKDAATDPRVFDSPLVTGAPHIRFYVGAPLLTGDGYPIGTLCAIDFQPRPEVSEVQIKTLQQLAKLVTYELDLRLEHRQRLDQLAHISHELRSPLNAVIGFSDMLRQEVLGPLGQARYQAYAEDIFCSGQHLLSLVNDILDASKLQAGLFTLDETIFDLPVLIDEVVRRFEPQAAAKSIPLDINMNYPAEAVLADRRALTQILTNLLANALKFSDPGHPIRLECFINLNEDLVLRVIDHGIGIAEADLPHIFGNYVQCDHKRGGTGLGLTIVRHLVELHQGRIEATSTPGQGSCFTVHLPASRIQPHQQRLTGAA